ncbi:UDP-glycosyltransferase 87A1-like [Rhododendron vialii]|uniref:UDP-glycosyltransferase 87A1-like n=1 Tax=Rhododendron vialii TaxID=182163 RepID=UPI00265FD997|nr:UDP-glycosyltransferase 87A1-like [Rhododendron vialii]
MATCHVVAMPYPGRGHINPMMNLCKLLSSRRNGDILVTFVVTEEWLGLISSETKPDCIRFVTIPNVLPSELVRVDDMVSFMEAILTKIEEPFEGILDRLEAPADVIVADTFLPWAVDVGRRRNIPVALFWPMPVTVFWMLYHFDLIAQSLHFPAEFPERAEVTVDNIPGLSPFRLSDLPSIFHPLTSKVPQGQYLLLNSKAPGAQYLFDLMSKVPQAQYLLFNSVFELEPSVIDTLQATFPFPVYSLGPIIPYFNLQYHNSSRPTAPNGVDYLEWLDSQPRSSVLYVSQGSFLSVSSGQMDEIAAGLHSSGVKYLLVARDKASSLKESFCSGLGMVVPWCDQLKVLCHPSVGGFFTHCGWNSTMESFFAGLPLLAFPIGMDQVSISKLVAEDWKIGWKVKGTNGDLVRREEITELVQRFMDSENVERKELVDRAGKIRETCRRAIGKGGSSEKNFEAFMKDISCSAKDKN